MPTKLILPVLHLRDEGFWKRDTNISEENTASFYIHGSAHRESNLITVQQNATYSVYYISVGSSTCFGC